MIFGQIENTAVLHLVYFIKIFEYTMKKTKQQFQKNSQIFRLFERKKSDDGQILNIIHLTSLKSNKECVVGEMKSVP